MNTGTEPHAGNSVMRVIKHELAAMLPPFVFFLIGFNLIALTLHLVLQPYGVSFEGVTKATVGALIIAKVVLIVDHLPFASAFSGRPLVRPVLFRSVVYTLFTMLLHVLEEVIRAWVKTGGLAAGFDAWTTALVWQHLLFVLIWVFALFLAFVTFDEIRKAFGLPRLPQMLWSRTHDR